MHESGLSKLFDAGDSFVVYAVCVSAYRANIVNIGHKRTRKSGSSLEFIRLSMTYFCRPGDEAG